MTAALAAGGFAVYSHAGANPGCESPTNASDCTTLADHAGDPDARTTLAGSHWDWVVLQEQSQIPALASDRQTLTAPAVAQLGAMVVAAGSKPMLLETWAHRDGRPAAGLPD